MVSQLSCDWKTSAPVLVTTKPTDTINDRMWLIPQGNGVAIVTRINSGMGNTPTQTHVFDVNGTQVAERIANSGGRLLTVTPGSDDTIYLMEVSDGGSVEVSEFFQGEPLESNPIGYETYADMDLSSGNPLGALLYDSKLATPNPPVDKPLTYYLAYMDQNQTPHELFHRCQTDETDLPVRGTPSLKNTNGSPVIASVGDAVHVFLDVADTGSIRHVSLNLENDDTTPRSIEAKDVQFMNASANSDQSALRVALAEMATNPRLFFGEIAKSDIGTFGPSDLNASEPVSDLSAIPIEKSDNAWVGDMFLIVGSFIDDTKSLGYALWDTAGHDRGRAKLAIRPGELASGESRTIKSVKAIADDGFFGAAGGTLAIAWMETRTAGQISDDRIYFDLLVCLPK